MPRTGCSAGVPSWRAGCRQGRGAPRADGDADPTAQSVVEIRDTFIEVDRPFDGAAHHLLVVDDRVGRAGVSADPAGGAEIVGGEIVDGIGD